MKHLKRFAALLGAVLLLGIFVLLLVSAFFVTPNSTALFSSSLFLVMAVPIFLFAVILVYRLTKDKNNN